MGKGDLQCNPIVVDGVIYTPTAGDRVVAIDLESGEELLALSPERETCFSWIDVSARR